MYHMHFVKPGQILMLNDHTCCTLGCQWVILFATMSCVLGMVHDCLVPVLVGSSSTIPRAVVTVHC